MKALYLNVENRICIGVYAVMSLDEVGKLLLLALLYVDKAAEHIFIFGKLSQLAEPVKVIYPVIVPKQLGYKGGKLPVAEGYPAALSDTVCLIAELLGRKAEPVCKNGVLEYLGVYLCNAVDVAGSIARHIRHVDKTALDHLYTVGLVPLYASCVHIRDKGFIYLNDYAVYPREKLLHQIGAPLFESLLHNGMVCVVEYLFRHIKGFLKGEALIVHQLSYELGYRDNGVGVIELN